MIKLCQQALAQPAELLHSIAKMENSLRTSLYPRWVGNEREPALAIQYAANWGFAPLIRQFYEQGALLEAENDHERRPLNIAAGLSHVRAVEYLLDCGAQINGGSPSALENALDQGKEAVVELLLERGADVSPRYVQCSQQSGHLAGRACVAHT
jgi:ankyrin repeat protein